MSHIIGLQESPKRGCMADIDVIPARDLGRVWVAERTHRMGPRAVGE